MKISKQRGFTLVEMMVAVTIFVVIVSIASNVFIRSLRAQRAVTLLAAINDNASQIIEQMARELRTGFNFELIAPDDTRGVSFVNSHDKVVAYRWNDDPSVLAIERQEDGGQWLPLTSPEVKIKKMAFVLGGLGSSSVPRVTITLTVGNDSSTAEVSAVQTAIQTTVSSRNVRPSSENL